MKRKLVYAIALCRQSMALHCNQLVDLDPALFPYKHRSIIPRDHVRFAYAIVTAYAVIEQLGFALHNECFKDGNWIKEKREELEFRLKRAGINISEKVTWTLRGAKTKLEKTRPPTTLGKCSWAYGKIRDSHVNVIDAIADIRWLRSRVSAHAIDSLSSLLSVHDVANSQDVAQRLILGSMGFDLKRCRDFYRSYGYREEKNSARNVSKLPSWLKD